MTSKPFPPNADSRGEKRFGPAPRSPAPTKKNVFNKDQFGTKPSRGCRLCRIGAPLIEPLSDLEAEELDDFYRSRLRPNERAAVLRRLAL